MSNLFSNAGIEQDAPRPLADRLRPKTLAEVAGQEHLLGKDGVLSRLIASGSLGSLIFWGPPGTGKTTIARLLAQVTDLTFVQISAIFSGVADLKKVFEQARARREAGQGTLLFVDEIHRFNRAQQDSFLPVRGSDPDAALYYLARMLDAGEDPLFIARRVVRMAVEDIGLADPQALVVANAAKEAFDFLGSPEGELALAQAVVYVATAPKSNAVYTAWKAAMGLAKTHGSLMPPHTILNAPTKLMKEEGYGAGYRYDHDQPDAFSGQNYWPEKLGRQQLYDPVERGFERDLRKRLDWWAKLRRERGEP